MRTEKIDIYGYQNALRNDVSPYDNFDTDHELGIVLPNSDNNDNNVARVSVTTATQTYM